MKRILYIGNNLTKKTKYNSTLVTLSENLERESYKILKTSDKSNKIVRLIDMIMHTIKYKNVDYLLIDTFSTVNFYYALVISQLSRLLKINYIPILHGGNLPNRLNKNRFLSNLIFRNSLINIAPSGYLKYEFEKMGYSTIFIPNILDMDLYQFKERKNVTPRLLYVRSFHKIYNPTMAIEVLNKLKKRYPTAELCMVGPVKDDSFEECKKMVKDYHLEKAIKFTGVLPKEEWHKLSENYDIFINTTNFDNTPVSVMEAMALGLPIVSTNAGGLPYLVENEKDGVLVNKNDIDTMVDAIINLIENPQKAYQMALLARKKAESFDWEVVKHKWFKILK